MVKQISAQVSLYPLGETDLAPFILQFWQLLEERGLSYQRGAMSTVIWGNEEEVFAVIQEGFHRTAVAVRTVMSVTFSNACPSSPDEVGGSH